MGFFAPQEKQTLKYNLALWAICFLSGSVIGILYSSSYTLFDSTLSKLSSKQHGNFSRPLGYWNVCLCIHGYLGFGRTIISVDYGSGMPHPLFLRCCSSRNICNYGFVKLGINNVLSKHLFRISTYLSYYHHSVYISAVSNSVKRFNQRGSIDGVATNS